MNFFRDVRPVRIITIIKKDKNAIMAGSYDESKIDFNRYIGQLAVLELFVTLFNKDLLTVRHEVIYLNNCQKEINVNLVRRVFSCS